MGSESAFLSIRDVAALLGISVSSVWRHAKDGTLPAPYKIGGSTRFRRDELLAAVEGLQAPGPWRKSGVTWAETTVLAKEVAK